MALVIFSIVKCLSKSKILKMLQVIDVEEKVTHS
jgi:hypothetical protein